jgi:hypothetical protein
MRKRSFLNIIFAAEILMVVSGCSENYVGTGVGHMVSVVDKISSS